MVVAYWAWAASTWVWGLDLLGEQALALFACLRFLLVAHFYFVFFDNRTCVLQNIYTQKLVEFVSYKPYTKFGVSNKWILCGVLAVKLRVKDRQQAPPHLLFARPRAKLYVTMDHDFKRYDASIKVIPCHSRYLWMFEVSTMSP